MKRSPLAALALMLALACAACNDDDPEPRFGPPESTSPAPTETETTSQAPDPLDPEETVRAWVKARNVTVRTADSTAVYALSTDATARRARTPSSQFVGCTRTAGTLRHRAGESARIKRKADFDSNRRTWLPPSSSHGRKDVSDGGC